MPFLCIMKHLVSLTDESLGLDPIPVGTYRARRAARAVLFNAGGKIALLHVGKRGYHKLPGGGMDGQETPEQAVLREIEEEVGVRAKLRKIGAVGTSEEYRKRFSLHQISYCFIADMVGDQGEMKRELDEIEDEQLPVWVSLEEAIRLIRADHPTDYEGRFIVVRDLAFLEAARRLLA